MWVPHVGSYMTRESSFYSCHGRNINFVASYVCLRPQLGTRLRHRDEDPYKTPNPIPVPQATLFVLGLPRRGSILKRPRRVGRGIDQRRIQPRGLQLRDGSDATMPAVVVCGKRSSSIFEDLHLHTPPPASKRARCTSGAFLPTPALQISLLADRDSGENSGESTNLFAANLAHLRSVFPEMDHQVRSHSILFLLYDFNYGRWLPYCPALNIAVLGVGWISFMNSCRKMGF